MQPYTDITIYPMAVSTKEARYLLSYNTQVAVGRKFTFSKVMLCA